MKEIKSVELKDLLGEHRLTGVDMAHESVERYPCSGFEDAQTINFVLDGKTYTAVEDPSDGYRSRMEKLFVSDFKVSNKFSSVRVLGMMRRDDSYSKNDVLEFVAIKTGKVVLAVGTHNIGDYYPGFVAEWIPENLPQNQK